MPRKASKNWGDGRNTIMLPVRVLKEDKISYIQALVDTRNNEDISIFVDSMTQLHIEHLRNDIDIFLKSTEEGNIDERKETTLKNVVESSQKSVEKSVEKIIKQIAENPKVTVKELTTIVGLSRRGVEKNIKKLQECGIIRRVGPDKGGHWEIIKHE